MKKKLLALVTASAMVFGLAACGSSSSSTDSTTGTTDSAATTDTTQTDTLYINLASEPDHLDPALNSSVDGACLAVNSFVGLYTYDQDENIVPALADGDPEVSEDGTVWTIKMIESKWSDGTELTANDFVYSWNRAVADETAADYGYLFDIVARNDDGSLAVEAVDDYTLQVTLVNACPYFQSLLAFPVFDPVPQASVEAADTDGTNPGAWAQEAGFVCNGAYTLETWNHNESMLYVKNDNYYDAANVTMQNLSFMLSADNTATYAAYNSGALDFVDDVPTDEIPNVINNEDFHIAENLGTYYVAFNVGADLFDGMTVEQAANFRQAISLLIDRQYIVDTVGQTGQEVADSYIPHSMSDGNGGTWDQTYYDASTTGAANVEEAVALLETCGYTFTDNGDGTYTPDTPISFPYILNENSGHEAVAQCIQQDLAVVGIDMQINVLDWQVLLNDRKNGDFTFAREGWLADYDDPINMIEMFASNSGNDDCQLGKTDSAAAPDWTAYDELVQNIYHETDYAARTEMLKEAEQMLMDTWAVIPIYYYNDVYMQKTNVDGIYATVTGNKYFMYATKTAE